MSQSPPKRTIKSFVKREGRMTAAQLHALDVLLPRYRLPETTDTNLDTLFGRNVLRYMEIGFGNGATLLQWAQQHPEADFLGIEVHRPGVGRVLHELDTRAVTNVRVTNQDALEVLTRPDLRGQFNGVYLLFPDPWPKKKHHKRRIVTPRFLKLVCTCLRDDGFLYIATDWEGYAGFIQAEIAKQIELVLINAVPAELPLLTRPKTKYETRGLDFGHAIHEFVMIKKGA